MFSGFASNLKRFMVANGFLFVLALIFSAAYVFASHLDQQSYVAYDPKVAMDIVYFRARFLLPLILKSILPHSWLDTIGLRFIVAFAFSIGLFFLIRPFCRRLGQKQHIIQIAPFFLFIILMMHYATSYPFNVYYVYDIPAIFFYVLAFLWLTDSRRPVFLAGIAAVLFFATNRETIAIATFHAAGYIYFTYKDEEQKKETWLRLGALTAAVCGTMVIKAATLHLLGAGANDFLLVHDNETFRLWANIKRVAIHPSYTVQMLFLGCGALVWLPLLWKSVSKLERAILISTLPTIPAFLLAENLTELRGYNEFVPLIALLFGRYMLDVFGRTPETPPVNQD